jgi:hypothetical protein
MIGDPGPFGEGIRPARLLAILERQPPPLAVDHVPVRQVEAWTGIVELLHERPGTVNTGRLVPDRRSGVPGPKHCPLALRRTEEEPAAAAHWILLAITSRPHPRGHFSQPSFEDDVHGQSMCGYRQ